MKATGWLFIGVVVCTVPLAIGIATGQSWTPYVTYAGWAIVAVSAIIRAIFIKPRSHEVQSVAAGVSDVYNEMYMGRPHTEVKFGNAADSVAEEKVNHRDELAGGKVSLTLPRKE